MLRKIFAISVVILIFASVSHAEYSVEELLKMTQNSMKVDWKNNIVFVKGVGLTKFSNSQGMFLARRAALTDARRRLLILRGRLLKADSSDQTVKISGSVPALKISGEGMEGNLYFVEVQTSLSELLGENAFSSLHESKIYELELQDD